MVEIFIIALCFEFIYHLRNDFRKIKNDITINHLAFTRSVLFILIAIFKPYMVLGIASLYLIIFNMSLNWLRDLPLDYIGKKAFTDKLLRFVKIPVYLSYLILIFISTIIYLYGK